MPLIYFLPTGSVKVVETIVAIITAEINICIAYNNDSKLPDTQKKNRTQRLVGRGWGLQFTVHFTVRVFEN